MTTAYRVGEALAHLVRRTETFCGVSDGDVLLYARGDRFSVPDRVSASAVVQGQARNYRNHRHLYTTDHQAVLDAGIAGLSDPAATAEAARGLLHVLSVGDRR